MSSTLISRADFPGLRTADGADWHYLDTAATAQKPPSIAASMPAPPI